MASTHSGGHAVFIVASIIPETELEQELLLDPRLLRGLDWGAPRFGHQEGDVGEHVAAMLASIPNNEPGLRVVLLWRLHGSRRDLIDRDADFVREALAAHPIFADTRPVEARIFHTLSGV